MRRGEVFWVRLDPTRGIEIRKTRPAIIVSNDAANRALRVASCVSAFVMTALPRR